MKRLWLLNAVCVLCCAAAQAQEPGKPAVDLRHEISPGMVTPTPEMWFYEQERAQHEDPKAAVRRKAEYKASQRTSRLAALQWYGFSNARPTASPTPWFGSNSPSWVGNTSDPNHWQFGGTPNIVVSPRLY